MYKFVNEYIRDHYLTYHLTLDEAIQIDWMYQKIAEDFARLPRRDQVDMLKEVIGDL